MKTAVALGTFDGVHSAHRDVLALPEGYKKVAVTFKIPPKMSFLDESELIITTAEKSKILKQLGFNEIVTLDFQKVKDTDYTDFLLYLKNEIGADYISCGFNYRFGKDGIGNTDILQEFCLQNKITLKVCKPYLLADGTPLSSSHIRHLLKNGEIEKANEFLYAPFSFTEKVLSGDKRGRTIGFPTINQKYPNDIVKLRFGVYKTKVLIDECEYEGITNIGIRPTYELNYVTSETYIKNFSGDLYGRQVTIIPVKFLRDEIKFSSLEELKKQIKEDIEK